MDIEAIFGKDLEKIEEGSANNSQLKKTVPDAGNSSALPPQNQGVVLQPLDLKKEEDNDSVNSLTTLQKFEMMIDKPDYDPEKESQTRKQKSKLKNEIKEQI
mmetsp:Transcript_11781/g.19883  ORF Transcript_11781/g.19883 Transcript_11781/m.19883 type:complete len:102 (-) Transcript_11781:669-974(-)